MKTLKFFSTIMLTLFLQVSAFAQTGEFDATSYAENAFFIFFIFLLLILITFLIMHNQEKVGAFDSAKNIWSLFISKMTGSKPVEMEEEILLNHEYDGIRELDNKLPPWWLYLFYITIGWSAVYLVYYHLTNLGPDMHQEYLNEVQEAELQKAAFIAGKTVIDENTVTVLNDAGSLFSGKEIYDKNCAACHGKFGEGLVGPNMTDQYWIHGGSIKDLFRTIVNGVPEKGMISWKAQLKPVQIQEVASYILSLQGTNPPNAKPAEGVLYTPVAESSNQ